MAAPDPTEIGRKLRQHDNEFETVYELMRVIDGKIEILDAKVNAGFERLQTGQREILDLLRRRPQDGMTTG
ncbi:MAG: hypothetical protein ACRDTC_25285 [Pseudonocardiaceae bacterium]